MRFCMILKSMLLQLLLLVLEFDAFCATVGAGARVGATLL